MDLIFGAKVHKNFPRKYLESETCGEGFWESTGQGNYKHTGVDVEKDIGYTVKLANIRHVASLFQCSGQLNLEKISLTLGVIFTKALH